MGKFTYSLILILTVLFPLIRSFEPKIHYYKKWKRLFKAILPVAVIFILADMIFTYGKVWGFEEARVLGIYIYNLPVEECLFFIAIPFSCIFIYEVLDYYFPKAPFYYSAKPLLFFLSVTLIITGIIFYCKLYTSLFFITTGIFILVHLLVLKSTYLGKFLRAYLVCLIPFLIVNGFLTALPVVVYNPDEITGLKIHTIPVEDFVYGMFLILAVLSIYKKQQANDQT